MGGFILTHFMSWDYNDTQVGDEFNVIKLYNFFANPETAMLATTILIGHVSQTPCFLICEAMAITVNLLKMFIFNVAG
jgi:hypothetical protein